jgi:hypothetical protein
MTMSSKTLCTAIAGLALAAHAHAALSPQQVQQLGTTLTPMGAEAAANAEGTIPAWTGGDTKTMPGFVTGGHYPDPYAADQPVLVIDAATAGQHQANLSPGQLALFKRYPDWKMRVYPTRRSAAFPASFYAETRQNAPTVELVEGGNGIQGASGGVPFPIPQNGLEAIWNHLTRYKGDTYATSWSQAAVTAGGDYTLVKFDYEYDFVFGNQNKTAEQREPNLLFYFLQIIKGPPRLAGGMLLVHEFSDQVAQPRKAWTYNTGQRRVRLAPNVAYDNPGTAADGLRTNDDFFMFNGATDRYDWTLVGKREMYVPYNAATLNGDTVEVADVLRPGHINPELARYELHRVWVVDAKLKAGTSHVYKRRTFYLDEDSWTVLVTDKYDNRDQLWRVDEQHSIQYPDVPMYAPGLEVKHDLQAGRYIALSLRNEESVVYRPIQRTRADFTPDALRAKGTR